jgi:hypothetical protein
MLKAHADRGEADGPQQILRWGRRAAAGLRLDRVGVTDGLWRRLVRWLADFKRYDWTLIVAIGIA